MLYVFFYTELQVSHESLRDESHSTFSYIRILHTADVGSWRLHDQEG